MVPQVLATDRLRLRFADVGATLALLASIAMGVLANSDLPDELRIHWGSPYYGPEFAPKLVVLVAFPLLVGLLFVAFRWLASRLATVEDFETVRPFLDWTVVSTLVILVAVQALLLWVNLG